MDHDARTELIRRLHGQGATQTDIARRLGLSRQRVSQLARELGLTWPKPMAPEERQARIPALMRQGLTVPDIAERLGVSEHAIHKDIRALPNVEQLRAARQQARPRARRLPLIPPLIEQGLATQAIADRLGVALTTIQSDIRDLDLPPRLRAKRLVNAKSSRKRLLERQ